LYNQGFLGQTPRDAQKQQQQAAILRAALNKSKAETDYTNAQRRDIQTKNAKDNRTQNLDAIGMLMQLVMNQEKNARTMPY
jgi:hypothetical protein